ncbi:hypothetical protein CYMTET_47501 [Cymbomonas tetramitiformis]|uniref:Nucleotide-diphospho-sugar transferase domain-containing protein n=1 Tax=Cymbomonas tetramitiformis TaxID=36881 RepID=A0AAE0EXN8_9CHLO|nr:hypothetical protein CYMTET_47501 [Cymbomonas tetramitiformis]
MASASSYQQPVIYGLGALLIVMLVFFEDENDKRFPQYETARPFEHTYQETRAHAFHESASSEDLERAKKENRSVASVLEAAAGSKELQSTLREALRHNSNSSVGWAAASGGGGKRGRGDSSDQAGGTRDGERGDDKPWGKQAGAKHSGGEGEEKEQSDSGGDQDGGGRPDMSSLGPSTVSLGKVEPLPEASVPPPLDRGSESEGNEQSDSGGDQDGGGVLTCPALDRALSALEKSSRYLRLRLGPSILSLGKLEPLSEASAQDDVERPGVLEAVAKARSYQNELILLTTNSAYGDLLLNYLYMLEQVGMEHYVIVTHDYQVCRELQARAARPVACMPSSFLRDRKEIGRLMAIGELVHICALKWHTASRLVKLGYNLLISDADVSFLQNPYPFFKGPFKDHTVIGMEENLRSFYPVNVGVVYVQNASPGGATAWAFDMMSAHFLRAEEEAAMAWLWKLMPRGLAKPYVAHRPHDKGEVFTDMVWDQAVFNDAFESACTQKVMLRRSLMRGILDANWTDFFEYLGPGLTEFMTKNEEELIPKYMASFPPEGILGQPSGATAKPLCSCEMAIPPDGGGEFVPSELRAAYAEHVEKSKLEKESLLLAPGWLISGWGMGDSHTMGSSGWWNAWPPVTAIAHYVGPPSGDYKVSAMRVTGRWDTRTDKLEGYHRYARPLLMLDTSAFDNATNHSAHARETNQLLLWAMLLNRTAVMPMATCKPPFAKLRTSQSKADDKWANIETVRGKDNQPLVQVGRCDVTARMRHVSSEPCCHYYRLDLVNCRKFMLESAEMLPGQAPPGLLEGAGTVDLKALREQLGGPPGEAVPSGHISATQMLQELSGRKEKLLRIVAVEPLTPLAGVPDDISKDHKNLMDEKFACRNLDKKQGSDGDGWRLRRV